MGQHSRAGDRGKPNLASLFHQFRQPCAHRSDGRVDDRVAQQTTLGFEARGLGICYMGTTLMAMGEIADFLELPDNVVPVTSLVLGVPAAAP